MPIRLERSGRSGRGRLCTAVWTELRSYPIGYGVTLAFVLAGPFAARWAFPEAPLGVVVVGGMLLGVWAALCAVPGKFLDED